MLLHMAGGASGNFSGVLPALSRLGHVVALDLPGHGRSDGPGRSDIGAYARVVAGAAETLGGTGGWVLLGHSMGGAIALDLATRAAAPTWLKGLVLVGSGARLKVNEAFLETLGGSMSRVRRAFEAAAWSPDTPDAQRRQQGASLLGASRDVIAGDFRACHHFDRMTALDQVRVPTLVVGGTADKLTPIHFGEFLGRHIPGARLERLPEVGHLVPLEAPGALVEATTSWFGPQLPGRLSEEVRRGQRPELNLSK